MRATYLKTPSVLTCRRPSPQRLLLPPRPRHPGKPARFQPGTRAFLGDTVPILESEAEVEAFQRMEVELAARQTCLEQLALQGTPLAVLTCPDGRGGTSTFYLVGTAHASDASCHEVAALIQGVRPAMVMVELCRERALMLSTDKVEVPSLGEVMAAVRAGKVPLLAGVYSWLLARVSRDLGVLPGGEFRVAYKEAHALGAPVALGDRPISITLARVWAALGTWEKARLISSLLFTGLQPMRPGQMKKEIESMKEADVLTGAMQSFAKDYPSLVRPLLTERDEFMVYIMRHKLAPLAHSVVVVVGAAHLRGIRDKWEADFDFEEIMRKP